jgi:NAD(P)-dependent dehydrogenase (short-subunit alcohol dehydrogenase family)
VNVEDRTVMVTGAARGIGRALARACARAGARVIATDLLADEAQSVGTELGPDHLAIQCDVTDEAAVTAAIEAAASRFGAIDMCFTNAGVAEGSDPMATSDAVWDRAWTINVRQHVLFARALLPGWLERGEGYFIATASAAGLLTQIGSAPYAVSKHAAVAFAEWLSVTYRDRGVRVSCLCPMGVETAMLAPGEAGALEELGSRIVRSAGDVLQPADVADMVLEAVRHEQFLILPHPEVGTYFRRKGEDYERWLSGMRRLQASAR